jgi:hypothetical protein
MTGPAASPQATLDDESRETEEKPEGALLLPGVARSGDSSQAPYYFVLHPVSTAMFIYTLLRSVVLTLWNDGIEWRGTKYPLEELRKGMV